MSRSDPPSGDVVLLVGLSAAVSIMIGFAVLTYSLTRPTVLPNVPFDMARQAKPDPIIARAASAPPPDIELLAVTLAARENEIQGLSPIAFAAAEPRALPAPATIPTAKAAKPKRAVAKAPRRDFGTAYASNWWGGGPSRGFGGFGGFGGGWYR